MSNKKGHSGEAEKLGGLQKEKREKKNYKNFPIRWTGGAMCMRYEDST